MLLINSYNLPQTKFLKIIYGILAIALLLLKLILIINIQSPEFILLSLLNLSTIVRLSKNLSGAITIYPEVNTSLTNLNTPYCSADTKATVHKNNTVPDFSQPSCYSNASPCTSSVVMDTSLFRIAYQWYFGSVQDTSQTIIILNNSSIPLTGLTTGFNETFSINHLTQNLILTLLISSAI